ncbi:hypothetical protein C8Q74DRAFT_1216082 [Fomes fomentarius]|nr:hypothetical protein C8Q74DRAFT_1216082 [Fomes fomentarius]
MRAWVTKMELVRRTRLARCIDRSRGSKISDSESAQAMLNEREANEKRMKAKDTYAGMGYRHGARYPCGHGLPTWIKILMRAWVTHTELVRRTRLVRGVDRPHGTKSSTFNYDSQQRTGNNDSNIAYKANDTHAGMGYQHGLGASHAAGPRCRPSSRQQDLDHSSILSKHECANGTHAGMGDMDLNWKQSQVQRDTRPRTPMRAWVTDIDLQDLSHSSMTLITAQQLLNKRAPTQAQPDQGQVRIPVRAWVSRTWPVRGVDNRADNVAASRFCYTTYPARVEMRTTPDSGLVNPASRWAVVCKTSRQRWSCTVSESLKLARRTSTNNPPSMTKPTTSRSRTTRVNERTRQNTELGQTRSAFKLGGNVFEVSRNLPRSKGHDTYAISNISDGSCFTRLLSGFFTAASCAGSSVTRIFDLIVRGSVYRSRQADKTLYSVGIRNIGSDRSLIRLTSCDLVEPTRLTSILGARGRYFATRTIWCLPVMAWTAYLPTSSAAAATDAFTTFQLDNTAPDNDMLADLLNGHLDHVRD